MRTAVQVDADRAELVEDLRTLFNYLHDQTLHNGGTHLDTADFVVRLELGIVRIVALVDVDRAELVEDLKSHMIERSIEDYKIHHNYLDKVDSEVHLELRTDTVGLAAVDRRLDSLADKSDFVVDIRDSVDRLAAGMLVAVVGSVVVAVVGHLGSGLTQEHFLVGHG